jgi:hypothetical protein
VRSTTTIAHAAIGRIGRPAFPAPSVSEGGNQEQNSGAMRGEIVMLWLETTTLFEI